MRVDVMARMRGVAAFADLWVRTPELLLESANAHARLARHLAPRRHYREIRAA
jgi:hypothetical protein